jgi:hypothetical protein
MKMLLAAIAFATGMAFASQAFAIPYCPNNTWQPGHYVPVPLMMNRARPGGGGCFPRLVKLPSPPL